MTTAAVAPAQSSQRDQVHANLRLAARSRPVPLLWAALAFAAGIAVGSRVWRPPVWWLVATVVLLAASVFFYRRRLLLSRLLSLVALAVLGALSLELRQISAPHIENDDRFARITDGREVVVEGYALRDGVDRRSAFGGTAQLLDFAVERAFDGNVALPVRFALRLNIYSQESYSEQPEASANAVKNPQLLYGQRARIPVKLRQPRNYGNPGAFDQRG